MIELSKTKLTDVPAVQSDISAMVNCTTKLPDYSEDIVGSVWHLTAPQWGYVVGHFYLVTKRGYIDITSRTDVRKVVPPNPAYAKLIEYDGRPQYALYWTCAEIQHDENSLQDKNDTWVCDIVVCKDGEEPATVNDGKLVLISTTHNAYPDKDHWYITSFVTQEFTRESTYYRVFHVYKSGYTSYDDM